MSYRSIDTERKLRLILENLKGAKICSLARKYEVDEDSIHLWKNKVLKALPQILSPKTPGPRPRSQVEILKQKLSKLQKEYKELFASFNLNNVIFEPITLKNKIIGWFLVADKNDKTPFSSNDIDLFNSIIPIYKVIIQNGILHREEQTKTKNLEHLRNIDRMLLIHKDLRQITDDIVESLVTIFSIEAAAILLLNKKKDALDIYCAKGISDKFVKKVKIKIGQGVTGICAQENKTIRINNVPSDERYISYPGSKTLSEMATPLTINEVVIGVLNIESIEKNKFSKNDEELFIDFALNTAVILKWVIENEK